MRKQLLVSTETLSLNSKGIEMKNTIASRFCYKICELQTPSLY